MFKVLKNGTAPTRWSKYSACVDLYASEDVVIGAGETVVVGLGVCVDISDRVKNQIVGEWIIEHPNTFTDYDEVLDTVMSSHYLQVMLINSLGEKGLVVPNGVGVIGLDYEDEIKIIIHNTMHTTFGDIGSFCIKKGEKIAQIILLEHKSYLFRESLNE